MGVTLKEVIEAGGFDLNLLEDAKWLKSVESEFETLIEEAEQMIEEAQEGEDAEAEAEYLRNFPPEEEE